MFSEPLTDFASSSKDLNGVKIASYALDGAGSVIDLSAIPAGAYLIAAGDTTLKLIR